MKKTVLHIPFTVLDNIGKITDTSPSAKAYLRGPDGAELFMRGIAPADKEKLYNLCSKGGDAISIDLNIMNYRHGIAVSRNLDGERFCEVYLLTEEENESELLLSLSRPFSKAVTEQLYDLPEIVAAALSADVTKSYCADERFMPCDAILLTDSIVSRLSGKGEIISSGIILEKDLPQIKRINVESVPYVTLLILILSVLDSASSSGIISLKFKKCGRDFEIELKTSTNLHMSRVDSLSALTHYIENSYIRLEISLKAAERMGMNISVLGATDGTLSVFIRKIADMFPYPEFKHIDESAAVKALIEWAVLSLASLIVPPEEGSQEEV